SRDFTLAGSNDPVQQVLDNLAFGSIRRLDRDQQPGKAGDGIGIGAGGVGDGDAVIGGHNLNAGSRISDAVNGSPGPVASRVLHFAKGDVVLQSVNQLNVSQSARYLAHQTGHAFIALAAHACRPAGRGALAGAV